MLPIRPRVPNTAPLLTLVMIGAALLASGCSPSLQSPAARWQPVNQDSLRAARERWAAARIEVYDYAPYCEVWKHGEPQGISSPHVRVRQGHVISAAEGTFLDHTGPLTMEGIFGVLEKTAAEGRLTAVFDRDTGVPLEVCEPLNTRRNAIEGSWHYCAVGAFHVTRRHSGNPERLRWPQVSVMGSCPHSNDAAANTGPDSPG